jgi:glycerate kinase
MRNWKTSFFGISAVISGIGLILKHSVNEGVTAIITGIGLIFSKDHDNK